MSTIFDKIYVNDQLIDESELTEGKYQLPAGEITATVKFKLKDPTTVPDVFYNNSQIKKIILGETITTIPDNAFYGTDIPEADKAAIIALKANAFEPKNQEPINPEPEEPEEPEEPQSLGLYYIGTVQPTDENVDSLEKSELQDWNSENYISFSLDIQGKTYCYVMLPKNLGKTIKIFDPNNLPQQGEQLESITDYDIYHYDFNAMTYKLYFE